MYISRVQLQPDIHRTSQLSHVLATNSYGLHQLLWDLFSVEEKRTFLFREEIAKEQLKNQRRIKGASLFYLVSRNEPQHDTPIFQVESKKYAPVINKGSNSSSNYAQIPLLPEKRLGKNIPFDMMWLWMLSGSYLGN
jgi:CRISPR system Cascade subunit CasE